MQNKTTTESIFCWISFSSPHLQLPSPETRNTVSTVWSTIAPVCTPCRTEWTLSRDAGSPQSRPQRCTHTPPCLCISPISDLGHTLIKPDTTGTLEVELFCCSPQFTGFDLVFCASGSAMFCNEIVCILYLFNYTLVYNSPGTFAAVA